jgi:hypothetical protein
MGNQRPCPRSGSDFALSVFRRVDLKGNRIKRTIQKYIDF